VTIAFDIAKFAPVSFSTMLVTLKDLEVVAPFSKFRIAFATPPKSDMKGGEQIDFQRVRCGTKQSASVYCLKKVEFAGSLLYRKS